MRSSIEERSQTLIMICEELCPSSDESKFPGSPADSQFAQMSIAGHIAQWNRAPTMSIKQLWSVVRRAVGAGRTCIDLLCASHARVRHGYGTTVISLPSRRV